MTVTGISIIVEIHEVIVSETVVGYQDVIYEVVVVTKVLHSVM